VQNHCPPVVDRYQSTKLSKEHYFHPASLTATKPIVHNEVQPTEDNSVKFHQISEMNRLFTKSTDDQVGPDHRPIEASIASKQASVITPGKKTNHSNSKFVASLGNTIVPREKREGNYRECDVGSGTHSGIATYGQCSTLSRSSGSLRVVDERVSGFKHRVPDNGMYRLKSEMSRQATNLHTRRTEIYHNQEPRNG
jgi:hypothetical protein